VIKYFTATPSGRGGDHDEVRHGQVSTIDEFFRAVVEYVYVAPSKVQSFRKQLEQLKEGNTSD
jgi:hypothetical protein